MLPCHRDGGEPCGGRCGGRADSGALGPESMFGMPCGRLREQLERRGSHVCAVHRRELLAVVFLVPHLHPHPTHTFTHTLPTPSPTPYPHPHPHHTHTRTQVVRVYAVPCRELRAVFGGCRVCGLPGRELLDCSRGVELDNVHAVPRSELLGGVGGCRVCELPRGELLDGSRGCELDDVHLVPRRDLLARRVGELHGLPCPLLLCCRQCHSDRLRVQCRLLWCGGGSLRCDGGDWSRHHQMFPGPIQTAHLFELGRGLPLFRCCCDVSRDVKYLLTFKIFVDFQNMC